MIFLLFLLVSISRWNTVQCGLFDYKTIRAHETICVYRTYMCVSSYCRFCGTCVDLWEHVKSEHPGTTVYRSFEFTSETKRDTLWYMMACFELFTCRFNLHESNVEWSADLKGSFSRAKELKVELELDGKTYPLEVVGAPGPTYLLLLHNDVIPSDDKFSYTLKIHEDAGELLF